MSEKDYGIDLAVTGVSSLLVLFVIMHHSWAQTLGFTGAIIVFWIVFHYIARRIFQ